MDLEFDKEMDTLLRKAAGRGVLVGDDAKSHLDAETIAAFAENALPSKSRTIYTRHLAACDPCRMTLAGLISLNAEAESAMAAAAAPVPAVSIPWYRKLFLAPNLAYVMGGLVLVFGGLFGLIVLQRSYSGDTATLSKAEEAPATQNAPARAEGANSLYSSNANSNAATNASGEIPRSVGVADQPTAESNSAVAQTQPMITSSDTAAAPPPPAKDLSVDALDRDKAAAGQPAPKEAPKREEDERQKNEAKLAATEQESRKQDANQVNIFRSQQNNQMTPGSGLKVVGPSRNDIQRDNRAYDDRTLDDKAKSIKKAEKPAPTMSEGYATSTRSIGGKTFQLRQGAWYDSSYSGQKTKNVRRSSDDYKKLDGGLRSIADTLGGTVVVVWNGKAYRIQ
jgi:hypothetical protein